MKKLIAFLSSFFVACCTTYCRVEKKPWTILIYIAGDNDLEIFIDGNIADMAKIGTNKYCNIVACVARKTGPRRTKTLQYILINNTQHQILYEQTLSHLTDTGQEETLRNFCTYGIENFPADHYGLIFWDHGTGPLDPHKKISYRLTDNLFSSYPTSYSSNILPALYLANHPRPFHKAVCFDDSTGNYLNEKKIQQALSAVCSNVLQNRKFDFIGFDTCLMATVEIASLIKKYAHYMIASQELEPGTGWNYEKALSLFKTTVPTPDELGRHIVTAYKKTYWFADDLTLSCINLEHYTQAENDFAELVQLLHDIHTLSPAVFLKSLLKTSAHKKNCTHFDEPEYIDIIHFLENLLYNFEKVTTKKDTLQVEQLRLTIKNMISKALASLQQSIIANTAGKDFQKASGLSIYFPATNVNKLYKKNIFCCTTQWAQLLHNCL